MFILLRPETPKEKEKGFRCGFLIDGEPGPELRLVNDKRKPYSYEVIGDERIMSLIAFQHSHNYKSQE